MGRMVTDAKRKGAEARQRAEGTVEDRWRERDSDEKCIVGRREMMGPNLSE